MGMAGQLLHLCNYGRRTLLSMMGFLAAMVVFSQFWALPSGKYLSTLSPDEEHSPLIMIRASPPYQNFVTNGNFDSVEGVGYNANNIGEEGKGNGLTFRHEISGLIVASGKVVSPIRKPRVVENKVKQFNIMHNISIEDKIEDDNHMGATNSFSDGRISIHRVEPTGNRSIVSAINNSSKVPNISKVMGLEARIKEDSSMIERYVKKMRGATITLSEMNTMLRSKPAFSTTVRRRGSATRDRQLLSASFQIKNAPVLRSVSDLHTPLFRNVSVFKRSYDLMEYLLKIYVYKEGKKPIFHNPRLSGLYAAEGWFMKLLQGSKRFTVRDPRKAHLYYMPFSSDTLRNTLYDEKSRNVKNLERYLADYVDLIKAQYHFWNKTGGSDHFFIACHDWGSRITRLYMSNCIRGLCNANVARGFTIGKDVSVPVTYIRSGNEPTRDIGGKPPSERDILVFFAGQLHGYLRPLLLQYWENKEPDMKIFGPLPRDVQGKAVYRDYMKSSKYCICARGYEVHTPRVVESIFYECVPVIISDNHVPPFFEVLDWEAFAVFVQEKDIPNLRNILLSIPEERYLVMQHNVRMVQRHFIWHKTPEKYDLFHMILHSVWYNRVSQIRPG